MKAVIIEAFGGPEKLQVSEMPKPAPHDQEVLIKVAYAGINPVDWKIREGYLKSRIPHEFPIILGWDVAGIVEQVGKNVKELKVGDEVFAYVRKPLVKWGSYAEYVVFDAKDVAKKPKTLTFAQAAAVPLASLTAWQSLFDVIDLKKGETILIQGGSGGVGAFAVQFAKIGGAKVLATARGQKQSYVKKFGADHVIDYQKKHVKDDVLSFASHGVDVVFDCVGGDVFQSSLSCLKKGGRIVSILESLSPEKAAKMGITAKYHFVHPSWPNLKTIATLIDEKKVLPPHITEMPLKDAAVAQEKLRSGEILGKIVLKI